MYIVSDDVLEQLICSDCKKYLSVKPVKVYPNRSIKCGRCVKPSDAGVTSLFGIVAENALFKCINRYDGCNQLLTYSQVAEHEKICMGSQYECKACIEPFKGTSYDIFVHFKHKHAEAFLMNNSEFFTEIDNELLRTYLYCRDDFLFFINVQYNRSDQELILNASHLGSDQQSSLIKQKFILCSIDRKIKHITQIQSFNSVSKGKKSFRINILENDFQKNVIICRFHLNTTNVENLPQFKSNAIHSLRKEDAVRVASGTNPGSTGLFVQPAATRGGLFNFTSTFGQQSNSTRFGFGTPQQNNKFLGAQQAQITSIFNPSGSTVLFDAFTAVGSQQIGTAIKFNPVTGTDTTVKYGTAQSINIKHHSITCMTEYENKSFEELRFEDYQANRKGPLHTFERFGKEAPSLGQADASKQFAFAPRSVFGTPPVVRRNITDVVKASTSKRDDSEEASKIKEKRLNKKYHINVDFLGPNNAGKSTIVNQIMELTEANENRTLGKYEREANESDKGNTARVGRAFFETDENHFTIFGVSGDEMFTPNDMIDISARTCIAILVISAKIDEWTINLQEAERHIWMASTIGSEYLVVLINKMDDPSVNWNEATYNEYKNKIKPYLWSHDKFFFIPCSGKLANNLKEKVDKFTFPWYNGLAFIPVIDAIPIRALKQNRPFMMPIVAKYKGNDGTVVTGKVEYGECRNGQHLLIMPNCTGVVVDMLLSDDDEVLSRVVPGENVRIKLKGVKGERVSPGFVLCDAVNPANTGRKFYAYLLIVKDGLHVKRGDKAVMHIHSITKKVTITPVPFVRLKPMGQKEVLFVKIKCIDKICLEQFTKLPQMGRFTLRDKYALIAIGTVAGIYK